MQSRVIRAPRGTELSAKSWLTEAPLRMLMNNLDPEVAERPEDLVVYGGIGKAARNWECYDAIVGALERLEGDQTLLVQSGKPVGIFRTQADAPRVLIANSNLVPAWATWEHFDELDRKGLMMYGQMTAGSWIYIGSQGIVQGTYETFAELGRRHYGGSLAGRWILTAGLGGMGGGPPLRGHQARRVNAGDGVPPLAHQDAAEARLSRRAGRFARRSARHDRARLRGKEGALGRRARQRGRAAARIGAARRQARRGHRPDLRARSGERLSAGGLDAGRMAGAARARSRSEEHTSEL